MLKALLGILVFGFALFGYIVIRLMAIVEKLEKRVEELECETTASAYRIENLENY